MSHYIIYYEDKTHKIAQTFRKLKPTIAYKTNDTIRKHLSLNNNLHKMNDYNKTEVYKLNIAIASMLDKYADDSHKSQ